MQTILVAGAPKFSSWAINHLLQKGKRRWSVIVMDKNLDSINEKVGSYPNGVAAVVDFNDEAERRKFVKKADVVLSFLSPENDKILAQDCIRFKKHFLSSACYTEDVKLLNEEAQRAGIVLLYESGLGKAISHMVTSRMINSIRKIAGRVTSFKKYSAFLIAPESDDNPWHYKFPLDPEVLCSYHFKGASWMENGKHQEAPFQEIFYRHKKVDIKPLGIMAAYPVGDAAELVGAYDLEEVKTIENNSLGYPSSLKAWTYLISSGLADREDSIDAEELTYSGWVSLKTGLQDNETLAKNFKEKYNVDAKSMKMLEWLNIFDSRLIYGAKGSTSGEILQNLLSVKWNMNAVDKDMMVIQFDVEYERRGEKSRVISTMITKGENKIFNAAAKTTGLPMGIMAQKILDKEIRVQNLSGVRLPIEQEIYSPVLKELEKYGIIFDEQIA